MAARGSLAKAEITEKILSTFMGSFLYNDGKEIRIPIEENGELIQVKVTLTAAKTNVDDGGATAAVTEQSTLSPFSSVDLDNIAPPSEEEQENVKKLIAALF